MSKSLILLLKIKRGKTTLVNASPKHQYGLTTSIKMFKIISKLCMDLFQIRFRTKKVIFGMIRM